MPLFSPSLRRAVAVVSVLFPAFVPGCGGNDSGAVDYGPGHALPRLLSETGFVAPGEPFTLGVTFDIEPEWHLYWNGMNDTGYPIQVRPELPAGFTAGELRWPAPHRKVSPGDILDHVYSGRVTLLLPVQPPPDLQPGSRVAFTCRLDWLSCKEACVPGEGVVSITLPVLPAGSGAKTGAAPEVDPEIRERFREARARLPVPAEDPHPGVQWAWADSALVVKADGGRRLAFYPYLDSAPLASLLRDGVSESGRLTLRPAENTGTRGTLSGVLEINPGPSGHSMFYDLAVPLKENP